MATAGWCIPRRKSNFKRCRSLIVSPMIRRQPTNTISFKDAYSGSVTLVTVNAWVLVRVKGLSSEHPRDGDTHQTSGQLVSYSFTERSWAAVVASPSFSRQAPSSPAGFGDATPQRINLCRCIMLRKIGTSPIPSVMQIFKSLVVLLVSTAPASAKTWIDRDCTFKLEFYEGRHLCSIFD